MRLCNAQLAGSKRILWITLASILLLRLLTLGAYPLLDRTEARYALIAKLMVQSGNWITPMLEPGVPYLGKPPLSFWANAASYLIFGINEFAARLPPFLALLITGALVFTLAMHVNSINSKNLNLPLVATCVFASSALPFYFAGAVMPDPILLLGITLAMVAFWMRLRGAPIVWGYLFFIGLAIGMLAKGLIGVVFPVLSITAWITWHRKWDESWRGLPWISGTLLALTLVMPWFLLQQLANPEFLRYFSGGS